MEFKHKQHECTDDECHCNDKKGYLVFLSKEKDAKSFYIDFLMTPLQVFEKYFVNDWFHYIGKPQFIRDIIPKKVKDVVVQIITHYMGQQACDEWAKTVADKMNADLYGLMNYGLGPNPRMYLQKIVTVDTTKCNVPAYKLPIMIYYTAVKQGFKIEGSAIQLGHGKLYRGLSSLGNLNEISDEKNLIKYIDSIFYICQFLEAGDGMDMIIPKTLQSLLPGSYQKKLENKQVNKIFGDFIDYLKTFIE